MLVSGSGTFHKKCLTIWPQKNPRRLRERRDALSFMSGSIQLLPRFKVALHREDVARSHLRGIGGSVAEIFSLVLDCQYGRNKNVDQKTSGKPKCQIEIPLFNKKFETNSQIPTKNGQPERKFLLWFRKSYHLFKYIRWIPHQPLIQSPGTIGWKKTPVDPLTTLNICRQIPALSKV